MEKVSFFFFLSKQRQAQGEHGGEDEDRVHGKDHEEKRRKRERLNPFMKNTQYLTIFLCHHP